MATAEARKYASGVPKVSVCIITHNHEKYIAQAIESVLMQETWFDYELVIGEDCSTDSTREIVDAYCERHPRIRLLARQRNLGMIHNFLGTLGACQGEYVSILEGDDYWTSRRKLSKQVRFLDDNPDYSICFHDVEVVDEHGSVIRSFAPADQKETSGLDDIILENYIPTCSVLFRNGLIKRYPGWIRDLKIGDWPLHILNAEHGKIRYLKDCMGAYRLHASSFHSSLDWFEQILRGLDVYRNVNAHFGYRYSEGILRKVEMYCDAMARASLLRRDRKAVLQYAAKCLTIRPYSRGLTTKARFLAKLLRHLLLSLSVRVPFLMDR